MDPTDTFTKKFLRRKTMEKKQQQQRHRKNYWHKFPEIENYRFCEGLKEEKMVSHRKNCRIENGGCCSIWQAHFDGSELVSNGNSSSQI